MDLMSTGLSGLKASSLSLAATANNVANLNTTDYKAKRVDFEEIAQGGVRAAVVRENPESGVDLASEIVNLQVQSGSYKANLKVIQTADEILGATLNMKA